MVLQTHGKIRRATRIDEHGKKEIGYAVVGLWDKVYFFKSKKTAIKFSLSHPYFWNER